MGERWYLVLYPGVKVLTSFIFNTFQLPIKTPVKPIHTLIQNIFINNCANDFESVVRKIFIRINKLLSWLSQYAPARLTGTGSCVFAEFKTQSLALNILNKTPDWVKGFVAKGSKFPYCT